MKKKKGVYDMNTCKKSIKKNENILFKDKHGNIEPFNSDEISVGIVVFLLNVLCTSCLKRKRIC